MGNGQEFAVEGTDLEAITVADLAQVGSTLQARLAELVLNHAECENRPVDR